jgi:hypothetical protein
LKLVHITKLDIITGIGMITKPDKKTVLVKIIIHDLFPEIDMHFIIQTKEKVLGANAFLLSGTLKKNYTAVSSYNYIQVQDYRYSAFYA